MERLIGTLRHECLDRMLIFGEAHLRRILTLYASYYNESRTHLSLRKDAPLGRAVQRFGTIAATPFCRGRIIAICGYDFRKGHRSYDGEGIAGDNPMRPNIQPSVTRFCAPRQLDSIYDRGRILDEGVDGLALIGPTVPPIRADLVYDMDR